MVFITEPGRMPKTPALDATITELSNFYRHTGCNHMGRVIVTWTKTEPGGRSFRKVLADHFAETFVDTAKFGRDAVSEENLSGKDCIILDSLNIAILGGEAAYVAHRAYYDMHNEEAQIPDARSIALEFDNKITTSSDDAPAAQEAEPDLQLTWGLSATNSRRYPAGLGVTIAILDSGFSAEHPDFIDRQFTHQSFIRGETTEDVLGHGTHITGTICGPILPATGEPRYGIAYKGNVLIAKVISNIGWGTTTSVLLGIDWALRNEAKIINLSLSEGNASPSAHYTQAGRIALAKGAIIVAAAGNHAGLTSRPANSPTILAVGAVDSSNQRAVFSDFGKIDLMAPGVSIDSALPFPHIRGKLNGTSMAAAHVSGIAALQAERGHKGANLWHKLVKSSKDIGLPREFQGSGVAQLSFS